MAAVEKNFQAKTKARSLLLKKQLHSMKLQPKESVNMYLARARSIMTDLRAIGSTMDETEVALEVLGGLPAEFGVVIEVLQYNDSLSFDDILPKLLHAEQLAKEKAEEMAAPIYGARVHSGNKCHYCHQPGHFKAQCKKRESDLMHQQGDGQQQPECLYCHKKGHWKSDCKFRISDERAARLGFPAKPGISF